MDTQLHGTEVLEEEIQSLSMRSLTGVIEDVSAQIRVNARQGATDEQMTDSQAMNVVEEAGEFIGEWRRLKGFARRAGDREAMLSELADVVISALVMFDQLGEDAEDHVRAKLLRIVTRGYVNKGHAS